MTKQPKTPHEEIMICIESTNAIVSKNSDDLQDLYAKLIKTNDIVSKILVILEKCCESCPRECWKGKE